MDKKQCCFAGHGNINDIDLEKTVYEKCAYLIEECGVKVFWIGDYGAFDSLAAKCLRRLKEKYPFITLNLILPYLTKQIDEYREMYYQKSDGKQAFLSDFFAKKSAHGFAKGFCAKPLCRGA